MRTVALPLLFWLAAPWSAVRCQQAPQSTMHHTAWTLRDGAPSDVFALAQTKDGYLWLGTSTGLFRFDGVEFERFAPRTGEALQSPNIRSLLALANGALYIGYSYGGVSVLENGHIRSYDAANGLPVSAVHALLRDSTGVVWAATGAGMFRQRPDTWEFVPIRANQPAWDIRHALVDRHGTIWIGVPTVGVFSFERGARQFVMRESRGTGPRVDWSVVEAATGEVWAARVRRSVMRLFPTNGTDFRAEIRTASENSGDLYAATDSSIWISNIGGLAVTSFAHSADGRRQFRQLEQLTRASGLSGQLVVSMITDREGNIWTGTEGGLDRFRRQKLANVRLPTAFATPALVPGDHGDAWAGNVLGPTLHISDTGSRVMPQVRAAQASFREKSGRIWLGTENGELWHSSGNSFVRDAVPIDAERQPIQSVALDDAGHLWISVVHKGVFCRIGAEWTAYGALDSLPRTTAIRLVTDTSGGLWFTYTGNRIARFARGVLSLYGPRNGLAIGNVTAIAIENGHVWVGGADGLTQLVSDRFVPVTGVDGSPFRGVTGIVETSDGELWLNGADGVTRVDAQQLVDARGTSPRRVAFERFDARDGLDGAAPQLRPLPSAVAGLDGTIWLATAQSVYRIVPAHIQRNTMPPPVHIRAIFAGGVRYAAADTATLPASTRALQIRYTALSLGIPDRVRFRYMLDGSDADWQDAGTRRDAFYTNLGPGTYRFRVIAANEDGVWNNVGDGITITIPPTFVQTPIFFAACVVVIGSIGFLAYRMRLRAVSTALRERYDVRLAERTRIAQDLHDTLLQGFTGLTLQLQGVHRAVASNDAQTGATLDRILTDADATLREARHAVWEMRAPEFERVDLVDALSAAASASLLGSALDLRVAFRGERRRLPSDIEVAALRIGREAVMNALLHAHASAIDIEILFEPRALRLCVSDNGIGVAPSATDAAERNGHWGLSGMRYRAERVGGTLEVRAGRTGGAEVVVTIPLASGNPSITS